MAATDSDQGKSRLVSCCTLSKALKVYLLQLRVLTFWFVIVSKRACCVWRLRRMWVENESHPACMQVHGLQQPPSLRSGDAKLPTLCSTEQLIQHRLQFVVKNGTGKWHARRCFCTQSGPRERPCPSLCSTILTLFIHFLSCPQNAALGKYHGRNNGTDKAIVNWF